MTYRELEVGDVLLGSWDDPATRKTAWLFLQRVDEGRGFFLNLNTGDAQVERLRDEPLNEGYTLVRREGR